MRGPGDGSRVAGDGSGVVSGSREMDAGSATSWLHVLGESGLLSLCFSFLICEMGTVVPNS